MVREYGIYQQGAMFTREDFDPYKTIKYLFDSYGIKLSKKLAKDIKENKVSDQDFDYICELFAGIMPTGESMMAFSIALNIFLSQGLMLIVRRSGVVIVATLFKGTSEP